MLAKHSVVTVHQLPGKQEQWGSICWCELCSGEGWQNPSLITSFTKYSCHDGAVEDMEFRAREEVKAFLMVNICSYPSLEK